jgi:hypothetical protein
MPAASPKSSTLTSATAPIAYVPIGRFDDIGLQIALERSRRLAEDPKLLERLRRIDLAGVLDGEAHLQGMPLAAEYRELIERGLVAQHALAGKRCREMRSYQAPGGSAISTSPPACTTGATKSGVAAHELRLEGANERIAGYASAIARITGMPVATASAITCCRYGISR